MYELGNLGNAKDLFKEKILGIAEQNSKADSLTISRGFRNFIDDFDEFCSESELYDVDL
eukprot:CAMPEP_0114583926 /NCGR_PEP_ID=MMETSP0125-20121206/7600_1 /TAXON_ID=485358 ORGANISM="Aristerostoma sp., Strain ATCC 50986" /NCGR_SAMPLE_ID=MMETSP0125 /ASSEMBLY_ACC=CAM_ASM_000245 /LENGTH=58 /DNA_ID=CAMNT_0001777753 /DNA_START=5167 /DNA_END=5343 /DNA_ORIENTATION=-